MTIDVRAADIRKQLQSMLQSPTFASSPRLSRLLRYTVEQTLAGRKDRLRESVIGREVFERSETFNPRTDSIVRVEARRLRSKLATYYATVGKNDSILIVIPSREYIPHFVKRPSGQTLALHNATALQQVASSSLQTLLIERDHATARELQELLVGFGFPPPLRISSTDRALEIIAAGNIHLVLIGEQQSGPASFDVLRETIHDLSGIIVLRIASANRPLSEEANGNTGRTGCLSFAELRCLLALLQIFPRAYQRVNGAHA